MLIYWVLFYQDPQTLQDLSDLKRELVKKEKSCLNPGLDIPPEPGDIIYDPYSNFDTEQADKMMRKKSKQRRIK